MAEAEKAGDRVMGNEASQVIRSCTILFIFVRALDSILGISGSIRVLRFAF